MRRYILTACLILLAAIGCQAQDTLNLQQCISYAWEHNVALQQAQLNKQQQSGNYLKAKAGALPNLNAGANQNYNYGRTIDPATNQFENQQNRTNYFSLQSNVTLFNGLQRLNEIRQAKWAEDAAAQNIEKTKQDVALSVANMYLQILLLEERRKQVQNQVANSQEADKRSKILLEAGSITKAKSLETAAQLATDQANLVDIENQLLKAYLNLKQYMNYDVTKPMGVAKVDFQIGENKYTESDLNQALTDRVEKQPSVLNAMSNRESAFYGLKTARGNYSPNLAASASLHSVYSSAYRNASYQIVGYEPIGMVSTDSSVVLGPKVAPLLNTVPFSNQFKNNFGESWGVALNIPIFNGFQSRLSVQNAKINLNTAELNVTDAKNKAKNDIYQAYEGMKMAEKKYQAASIKLQAQESLFNQTEVSYNAGALSYYDYSAQRILYNNAQLDELQARYEYIFQTKIFEYYMGKPVQF